MSLIALIPARGGSKGIPKKNVKDFCGKPLIAWSIDVALQATEVDRVIVTTDDQEIADISLNFGAEVPFLRPERFATDETPGIEPVLHAISVLPQFDWVLVLQPTSPLRITEDIASIVNYAHLNNTNSAVSVVEASNHPHWTYLRNHSGTLSSMSSGNPVSRRQELPRAFALNGALYLAKREWIMESKAFVSNETYGYVMPRERSVDIDSPLDWKWAEFLMRMRNQG
jgi:CMP-N,N'-diacetyllegionaminic acid synthase